MTERSPPIEIGFIVFPNVQQLDLTGPCEVFASLAAGAAPSCRANPRSGRLLDEARSHAGRNLRSVPATRRPVHSGRGRDRRRPDALAIAILGGGDHAIGKRRLGHAAAILAAVNRGLMFGDHERALGKIEHWRFSIPAADFGSSDESQWPHSPLIELQYS